MKKVNINVVEFQEIAKVGSFNNIEINIWTNDPGVIPCFRFKDLSNNNEGCIQLPQADYFVYDKYNAVLNPSQKIELLNFLKSDFDKSSRFVGTNWDYLILMWNMNNPTRQMDEDIKMPDYLKL